MHTATQQLIQDRVHQPLRDYVAAYRAEGESWESIARCIKVQAQVDVSGETIRRWFAES